MSPKLPTGARALATVLLLGGGVPDLTGQEAPRITQAIIGEPEPVTPEISTDELQRILVEGRTPVLDVRSAQEYAIAHIPGSVNYYEKEIEQITAAYPDSGAR